MVKKVRETKAAYAARSEQVISIPVSVMDDLNELVKLERAPMDQVLYRAVAYYRRAVGHRKIDAEVKAYHRKHPRLRAKYLGKYIAMHNGRVVDHDQDASALYQRIRKRFGQTPVLIRLVEEVPERVLVFRSPRLEPIQ
jgi:hypothetical protein